MAEKKKTNKTYLQIKKNGHALIYVVITLPPGHSC